MSFTSAEIKLRTLAAQDSALQDALGGSSLSTFRWYNRQLLQNEITAGRTCVRVQRVSTIRPNNTGGVMNLSQVLLQIDVLDFASETARSVAEDVVTFMGTVDLCSAGQFNSPLTSPNQNPNFLLTQVAGMIPNPQNPNGPVYYERQSWRCFNREDIAIT